MHGLQATAKGNVRPANAPPYETWFVDNDGQFDDADFYSRVGNIAIYDPCDEVARRREPAPPLSPPLVPLPPSGIWIKKVCTPAPFGGPIHCTITVTNSSGAMPEAPVTLWDAATILAGPGAGGAVTITAVVPDIAQWFCSPTPTANLSCTLAPEWLPPGASHSIDVTVDTAPLLAAGNHGFRNCAVLGAPWYGEACADGGTQLTIVKTAPAGVRAWRRLHVRHHHHQHRVDGVQRRRRAERQHVHGRRRSPPRADHGHRAAAGLRACPGRRAVLVHGAAYSCGRRCADVRHHGNDAHGRASRILGAQLHRRLGPGRAAAGTAARRPDPFQCQLRVGARRRAAAAQQPAAHEDRPARRKVLQGAG